MPTKISILQHKKVRLAYGLSALWIALLNMPLANAQEQSNVSAWMTDAARFENGEGVARDYPRALELYCLAARAGDRDAQYAMGWMYANGRGVERSDTIAARLMQLAAAQGHEHAKFMLNYLRHDPQAELPKCMLPEVHETSVEQSDSIGVGNPLAESVRILVAKLAPKYKLDPVLALAVIKVESGFNPRAISPKNAKGLMQLIPETAERFHVRNVYDPEDNIRGGMAYLRSLLDMFNDDVKLTAAAYNAGEKAVLAHRGVPPYPETRDYVQRVLALYKKPTHVYHAVAESKQTVESSQQIGLLPVSHALIK